MTKSLKCHEMFGGKLMWSRQNIIKVNLYRTDRVKYYGGKNYGSAAKTHLEKRDNIKHQAPRICPGAFRTAPTATLKVEM